MEYYFYKYPEVMEWFNINSVSELISQQSSWFNGKCEYSGSEIEYINDAYRLPISKNIFLGCYSKKDYLIIDNFSIPDFNYNKIKRLNLIRKFYKVKDTVVDMPRYTDDKLEEFYQESMYYDYLEDKYYEDLEKEIEDKNDKNDEEDDDYF